MEASPSIPPLDEFERRELLETAADAIESRLGLSGAGEPVAAVLPAALSRPAATFVSLHVAAGLRGCCGALEAERALAADVWHNARACAFGDPRFEPLSSAEWPAVTELSISVLSGLETFGAVTEAQLLRELEPGSDGLLLVWRGRRATFLPKVWDMLPDPHDFLRHLKAKAGWSAGFWAEDLRAFRYTTVEFALDLPAVRHHLRRQA